jgi:hypothetical protein
LGDRGFVECVCANLSKQSTHSCVGVIVGVVSMLSNKILISLLKYIKLADTLSASASEVQETTAAEGLLENGRPQNHAS